MIRGLKKILKRKIKEIVVILSILFLVLLDQFTKLFFENRIYFEDFFISIKYSQNFGSTLSIFSNIENYSLYIGVISIIVLIGIIYLFKEFNENKFDRLTLIFFVSGIIGNTIDRFLFGHVIDFIYLKHFFIFNIADIYLNLAFILIIYIQFIKK